MSLEEQGVYRLTKGLSTHTGVSSMRVNAGQRIGGLAILVVSLAVYGGIAFLDRYPPASPPLPWGDQGAGRIAIEVRGSRSGDGIYFMPETTVAADLSAILGADLSTADVSSSMWRFSSASPMSISTEGGALKVADMPEARKLALGLPIDLNRATENELMLVPGIGEKMAARIVESRQSRGGKYARLADLTTVPGIKEKKLRELEKYMTVRPLP